MRIAKEMKWPLLICGIALVICICSLSVWVYQASLHQPDRQELQFWISEQADLHDQIFQDIMAIAAAENTVQRQQLMEESRAVSDRILHNFDLIDKMRLPPDFAQIWQDIVEDSGDFQYQAGFIEGQISTALGREKTWLAPALSEFTAQYQDLMLHFDRAQSVVLAMPPNMGQENQAAGQQKIGFLVPALTWVSAAAALLSLLWAGFVWWRRRQI